MVPGTGLLAACVPGTFDTWMMLLRDYGTMRLADVLAPAISYATNGYPLVERASATIATVEDLFRDHWPTSAAVYLPGGKVPAPGTHVHQSGDRRHLYAHPARGAERRRQPRGSRSSARARPGRKASSPRRSIASAARRRSWTPAASAIAAC